MESLCGQLEHEHEQQLHQSSSSSLLPYCFLSAPEPLPVPGFPAGCSNLEEKAAAAMAAYEYESSSCSSLDPTSMPMVYSPIVLQPQECPLSFVFDNAAAAAGDNKWVPGIQGSCPCSLGSTQDMVIKLLLHVLSLLALCHENVYIQLDETAKFSYIYIYIFSVFQHAYVFFLPQRFSFFPHDA